MNSVTSHEALYDSGLKVPYLVVLTSSNQLDSGTGTSLFEWIKYSKSEFAFSIIIDNQNSRNYTIARDFCRTHRLGFIPSGPARRSGAVDPGVACAQYYVGSGAWPIVEIVSWANTATNLDVVTALRGNTVLVYTPHTQPAWTVPGARHFPLLEPVFDDALRASHLVCCISPAEVQSLAGRVPGCRTAFLPHGINTSRFHPGFQPRLPQILMVADFREPRKRTDLAFAAMERLARRDSSIRYVLAGRDSDSIPIPAALESSHMRRRGFVSDEELVKLYQTSAALLLLSDFEAFGLPIAEALACGLPVILTGTPELSSLFNGMPGCYLVRNTDPQDVDRAIDLALREPPSQELISKASSAAFDLDATLGKKLRRIKALVAEHFKVRGSNTDSADKQMRHET